MIPRLIHPIQVLVEQVDVEATEVDPDFRESRSMQGATFQPGTCLAAQIRWGAKDEYRRSLGGDEYKADGHFTFLVDELARVGLTLHKGDRVSSVADQTMRYRITEIRPAGHYHGRHYLIEAVFKRLEGND